MPLPIQLTAGHVDLSERWNVSTAIQGSPALAAETVVAQVNTPGDLFQAIGVRLSGWVAFTVGTSGTAITVRLRRTSTGGTLIASSGALTGGIAAGNLVAQDCEGMDTNAFVINQLYVLTLQVTAGAATSTVSAALIEAIVI